MISLHSHSGQFCSHATGTLPEIIEAAKQKKFKVYGLSEHIPRHQKDLYPDEEGISQEHLKKLFESYYVLARSIQAKEKDLVVLVGFESEWTLESLPILGDLQSCYDFDYVLGSVHHVLDVPIDYNVPLFQKALEVSALKIQNTCACDALYQIYYDHQYDMIEFLKPNVIGHFDLPRLYSSDHVMSDIVIEKVVRNVKRIVNLGILVEINSRALKKGLKFPYPFPDVLKIMIDHGVKFTISDDSHGVEDVGICYGKLFEYLETFGISTVFYPLKKQLVPIKVF